MPVKKLLWLLLVVTFYQGKSQQVVSLYADSAPGSEEWNWEEKESLVNVWSTRIVYNVVRPSLLAYLPPASMANGTAVIICPGGGFQALSIDSEGIDVAKWLNEKGVAAFVLKYRLMRSFTEDPISELSAKMGDRKKFNEENASVVSLATADAKRAIEYVRQHAIEFNVNPERIGLMGFSAGGTLTASVAYTYTSQNRPDFVAPVYAYVRSESKTAIQPDAPPMFVVAATDDQLGLASHSVDLYRAWLESDHNAELHLYAKGGHGFGMRVRNSNTDTWIDRFGDWLAEKGLLIRADLSYTPLQAAQWKKEREERIHNDWAFMKRFQEENKKLSPPMPGENRVVFMGNSITEGWGNTMPSFFKDKPYVNRGISGQTTPQMVLRFKQDVIDLKPAVVVILAGTNDIAGNTGPTTLEQIRDNIITMAQLARANGIKVVLCSVLPAYDYPWKPGMQPAEKIVALNRMIKEYAVQHKIVYVDFFSPMADEHKGLKKNLGDDGVHPNAEGYSIMAPLVEKAIAEALKRK